MFRITHVRVYKLVWIVALVFMIAGLHIANGMLQEINAVVVPYCLARAFTMIFGGQSETQNTTTESGK